MCDLTIPVSANPPVGLEPAYPEINDWAERYVSIFEFVASLLRSKHQLCYLVVPRVEHQLKFSGREVDAACLEVFYLLKCPMPY